MRAPAGGPGHKGLVYTSVASAISQKIQIQVNFHAAWLVDPGKLIR